MLAWERAETGPLLAAASALAMGLPLVVLVAVGHPREAVYAAFGSFTGLYALDRPLRSRARVLGGVGVGFTAAVLAGSLAASSAAPWLWVLTMALVAGSAKWGCNRAGLGGGPGAWMFLFTFAACFQPAAGGSEMVGRVLLAAGGAAAAWCVSMITAWHDPDGPARRAVAAVLEATAVVVGAGPAVTVRELHHAHVALIRADGLARQVPGRLGDHLEQALSVAEELLTESALAPESPRAAAADALRRDAQMLSSRSAGLGTRTAVRSRSTSPARAAGGAAVRVGRRRGAGVVRTLTAVRVLAGSGVAAAGALLLHLGHPYWAPVSATAVLQSLNVRATWHRGLQRGLGTAGGVVVGGVLLAAHPSPFVIAVLVVVMQWAIVLLGGRNYAAGVLFVTPFAVMLSELLRPSNTAVLLIDRLTGVALGILVGVGAALLVVHPRAAVTLREAVERCRLALDRPVLDHEEGGLAATEELRDALVELRVAEDIVRGEPWPAGVSREDVADLEHRAYRVLAERRRELRIRRHAAGAPVVGEDVAEAGTEAGRDLARDADGDAEGEPPRRGLS